MTLGDIFGNDDFGDLVDAWLAYYRELDECGDFSGQAKPSSPYYWAIDTLDDICRHQPEKCWELVVQLVDRATSDVQRASIAAGPLEDLLSRNGPDFIERVEALAQKNEKLRELLNGIWRNTIDAEVWQRIQRLRQ